MSSPTPNLDAATPLLDVAPVIPEPMSPAPRRKQAVTLPATDRDLSAYAPSRGSAPSVVASRSLSPLAPAAMYCDGGLLGPNPCPDGGTWAWRLVNSEGVPIQSLVDAMDEHEQQERGVFGKRFEAAGLLLPSAVRPFADVSNNLTELIAMLRGMQKLPAGWSGTIYSDSRVTICRVQGYKFGNALQREKLLETVPARIADEIACQRARLGRLTFVLLDGHPTKEQLAAGVGKRGAPVSEHNVWCDSQCNAVKAMFWKSKVPAETATPEIQEKVEAEIQTATEQEATAEISAPTPAPKTLHRSVPRAVHHAEAVADPDDTIQAKFEEFHRIHPEVYGKVVELAWTLKQQRDAGRCKWVSIGAIWERLRSDWLFAGRDSEGYKLNNNYRSRYARLLIADFPEFAEIIETRELQSK